MFAVVCYISAWLTLVSSTGVSIFYAVQGVAISALLSGMPSAGPSLTPSIPGGSGDLGEPGIGNFPGLPGSSGLPGGSGLPGAGGMPNPLANPLVRGLLQTLVFVSVGVIFVSGLIGWLFQLALGQVCHTLVDVEEQNYRNAQALHLIMSRLGAR